MVISIIIVNYNTTELVDRCLNSILLNIKDLKYETIVVDNCSADRSIEMLKKKYSEVDFYFRDVNSGFGSGCNYGFSKSKGRYILFLNPDTCLTSNIVKDFYELLESNDKIGVCSTLLEDFNGNLQYCFNDFPGIKWELLELTGYFSNRKIAKMLNNAKQTKNDIGYIEIDWAIGACLFVRREAFEKINGFDEDFFLYYEDTDLQKRINNIGYKVKLLNRLKINHEGKSSIDESENGDNIYHFNMHISKLNYYRKHSGRINVFFVRIINILAFTLRLLILPVKNPTVELRKSRKNILIKLIRIYLGLKNV
jgi:hypothetical protein